MQILLPQKIDYIRAIKYIGGNQQIDDDFFAKLENRLFEVAKPRVSFCELNEIPSNFIIGSDIKKHLSDCDGVLLYALTLGNEVDKLIRLSGINSIYEQVVLDALASVLTEQTSEDFEKQLVLDFAKNNKFLTSSYAPGYGDYPLRIMPKLASYLDINRKIGLSLTNDNLLTPRKSILVLMGISDHPVSGFRAGCEHCERKNVCKLHKEGKTCVR